MKNVFKENDIIKHEKNLDIAYMVTGIDYLDNDIEYVCQILNQGFVSTYMLGYVSTLRQSEMDLADWFICLEPDAKCIRYSPWKPVLK